MRQPTPVVEVVLHQGEVYCGDRNSRIRTLLGSCVAITMWHPGLLLGGMCHYLLPTRHRRNAQALDGKYADEALALMLDHIRQTGAPSTEYQVKLFGGGNMFPDQAPAHEKHVGMKNIEMGRKLIKMHGLSMHAEHLGGLGHRNLIFNLWSGDVWVRQQPLLPLSPGANCEAWEPCQSA